LAGSLLRFSVGSCSLDLAPSSSGSHLCVVLGSGASGSGSGALGWPPCGVVDLGFGVSDLAPSAEDLDPCADSDSDADSVPCALRGSSSFDLGSSFDLDSCAFDLGFDVCGSGCGAGH